jgi:hypothetical protein
MCDRKCALFLTNVWSYISLSSIFLNSQTNSGAPKAYINWVLLDEQFHVAKNASGNIIASGYSGFDQVKTNGSTYQYIFNGLTIAKSGYLYVYTSNESTNVDAFFDNFAFNKFIFKHTNG